MIVSLRCGDCREELRSLASFHGRLGQYRAIVSGPPYWGAAGYLDEGHPEHGWEIGSEANPELYAASITEAFGLARPLLFEDGALWMAMGEDDIPGQPHRGVAHAVAAAMMRDGWHLLSVHSWQRQPGMADKVFLFAKSLVGAARLSTIRPRRWLAPAEVPADSKFQAVPVSLAADCIAASTYPDDWVLDPFAGSGSIGEAAYRAGRNALLIETDPVQTAAAQRRLTAAGVKVFA